MSVRRRLLAGAAAALALALLVAVLVRSDGSGGSDVDAIDATTSTSRAGRSGPTSTAAPDAVATTGTTAAVPPSTGAPGGSGAPAPAAPGTTRPVPPPPTAPPTTRGGGLAAARIRLTPVVDLRYPIAMATYPGDGSQWIAMKDGTICHLQGSTCPSAVTVAAVSSGGEQGLLGIAFDPAGSHLYASYMDPAGDSRVDAFRVGAGGAPDLASRRTVLTEDQPESNHNGGHLVFGPDGRLYLGLGDGGGAGDRHGAVGNAQDPATDLGKILRIDPAATPPVVERWIRGVRNPWRFSFDRATGDLWIGDVGQGAWEEVDLLPAGAQQGQNLGWRCFEGTHSFSSCGSTNGMTGPIFEYSHAEGCSITGGFVYRGARIPDLAGAYLFADYCDGELRALVQAGGRVTGARRLGVDPGNVVSFGQDAAGELYVLTPSTVFRIDPA
jgi:glucose/arabinose dehydrogenase